MSRGFRYEAWGQRGRTTTGSGQVGPAEFRGGEKTSGHVLRIVHEHTSAPIGFEDAKAILKREGKT